MQAASRGHLGAVRLLLASGKVEINQKMSTEDRPTALQSAVEKGHEDVGRFFLDRRGMEISNGNITLAVLHAHDILMGVLLDKSPKTLNCRAQRGNTALMAAVDWGRQEVVKILLSYPEIDINLKNDDDETALERAYLNREIEIAKLLL